MQNAARGASSLFPHVATGSVRKTGGDLLKDTMYSERKQDSIQDGPKTGPQTCDHNSVNS